MIDQLFLIGPATERQANAGTFDPGLVILTCLVSILSAAAAVALAGWAARAPSGRRRRAWQAVGGIGLGLGLWAAQVLALLAHRVPESVTYDLACILGSLAPAIAAGWSAVVVLSGPRPGPGRLIAGGVATGFGLAALHAAGVSAMRMHSVLVYHPAWSAAALAAVIGLATLAPWARILVPGRWGRASGHTVLVAAPPIGLVLAGAVLTAMTATRFLPGAGGPAAAIDRGLTATELGPLVAVAILIVVGLIALASLVGRPRQMALFVGRVAGIGLTILVAVGLVSWLALAEIKRDTERELETTLEAVRNTTHRATRLWIDARLRDARQWALGRDVHDSLVRLLALTPDPETLKTSAPLATLRRLIAPRLVEHGDLDFFVVSRDLVTRGALTDDVLGVPSPIAGQGDHLERVFRGESRFVLPEPADPVPPTVDGGAGVGGLREPTMLLAVPVVADDVTRAVIAALIVRLDPSGAFTTITQLARTGTTGDTYAIDRHGRFVTEPRFGDDLVAGGLLTAGDRAVFNLGVRDPGGNLVAGYRTARPPADWPLTRMAEAALAGRDGVAFQPYRDYRGVPVVGAWRWDDELGLALAFEIDAAEAYGPYHGTRRMIAGILGVGAVMLIASLAWITRNQYQLILSYRRLSREIEDRCQAEAEVARWRNRYEIATLASGHVLYDWSPATNEVTYGGALEEILGYSLEEMAGGLATWIDRIHPDDRRPFEDAITHLLATGDVANLVYRVRRKDGCTIMLEDRGHFLTDPDGTVIGMIGFLKDITEQKRQEEALIELSNSLTLATRAAQIGIWDWRPPTNELMWDERMFRLYGVTRDSFRLTYQDWRRLAHPDDLPRAEAELKAALDGVRDFDTEFRIRRPDGTQRWVQAGAIVERGDDGSVVRVIGMNRDITQIRDQEAALREARDLADRAREKAERATRAKSEFLANMSHEIRTPLNTVLGMTYLAKRTELTAKQTGYLDNIQSSTQHLLGVIDDILDFSKIEAGQLAIETIPFDLDDILDNLSDLLTHRAEEKDLEILFSVAPDVPRALIGDPLRLGQILINLASNAVKFTAAGEVVVKVRYAGMADDRGRFDFSVRDTGIGMSQDQITNLFQSFHQADTSITRRYGGTGLGLVITRRLVEAMGGTISVASALGRGSEFSFSVPLGLRPREKEKVLAPPEDLHGLKVLIVDDNQTSREIVSEILGSLSFTHEAVASGPDALHALVTAAADDRPFDLVLMDWNMPGMDGIEASRRIAEHPALSNRPIVVMVSAYSLDEARRQAELTKIRAFLNKPISPSILFDTIMAVFGKGLPRTHRRHADLRPTEETARQIAGARVLIVEDQEINREMVREILVHHGVSVEVAVNGRDAVALVEADPARFDAVLMDLQMPVMDGFEATRQLRARRGPDDLPIMAMTAHAIASERTRCLDTGMNAHIAKPVNVHDLLTTLADCLGRSGRPAVPTPAAPAGPATDPAFPDRVPGLDLATGLARVVGNRRLFARLLRSFSDKHGGTVEEVSRALAAGDRAAAIHAAHALAGVACTISADTLADRARRLEAVLRADDDGVDRAVAGLARAHDQVLAGLATLELTEPEEDGAAPAAPTAVDRAAVADTIGRLRTALVANDLSAAALVGELRGRLAGSPTTGPLSDLKASVDALDFDAAMRHLDTVSACIE